jgi:hypothetical protein
MDKAIISSGKRHSFFSLFREYDFTIEIPTIQRDYAQGRKSKQEVRDSFLLALYNYLKENKPGRDLDFVYGTIETDGNEKKFIPLDGQQRLTTLFLLHWYLSVISGNLSFFKDLLYVNKKSRFTYLTRPSSTDFLNALISADFSINEFDESSRTAVSDVIKNQGWFFLSWMYDSTINSILNMLDDIHVRFKGNKEYYNSITDTLNPIITFLFLDLNKFKLTEDLYIKMNARGKPLTPFENFKANFEKHIGDLFGSTNKPFQLKGKKVTYKDYFSFQIDTAWANLFWNYRELVGKPNTFDEEIMNFLGTLIILQYASNSACDLQVLKNLINYLTFYSEDNDKISFYRYDSLKALDKELVAYFISSLDTLTNGNNKIKNYLPDKFYYDENVLFDKTLKGKLSAPERVLFHAYLKYLIINSNNVKGLHQWMRVTHNLVINSRFDDDNQFYNAIQSINKLIPKSSDIIGYLITPGSSIDFFDIQKDEEILKAHLINKSEKWAMLIEDAEKSIFHNGQIGYLLEFSGILKYIEDKGDLNWNQIDDDKFYIEFKKYLELSVALFTLNETNTNDYVLERALLTKGDYLIPASNQRRNFCSSKHVSNYIRDFSWKRLLRIVNDDVYTDWSEKRNSVKKILDDKRFDKANVRVSLENIIKDGAPDWRNYFIQNISLIEFCSQGFIGLNINQGYDDIELYGASQLNHYHLDMFIYDFYCKNIFTNEDKFLPFNKSSCIKVKGYEKSYLWINEWTYLDCNYDLKIYRNNNLYIVKFRNSGNTVKQENDYEKKILEILINHDFIFSQTELTFIKELVNEKELKKELLSICNNFNNLKV